MLDANERKQKFNLVRAKTGAYNAYINVFLPIIAIWGGGSLIFAFVFGEKNPFSYVFYTFAFLGAILSDVFARRLDDFGQMWNLMFLVLYGTTGMMKSASTILSTAYEGTQLQTSNSATIDGAIQAAATGITAIFSAFSIVIAIIEGIIVVTFCALYIVWFVGNTRVFHMKFESDEDDV